MSDSTDFFAQPMLAVDTEFVWNKTYYAQLGLVQLCPGGGLSAERLPGGSAAMPMDEGTDEERRAVLLDPFRCDPREVGTLLADGSVVKVLHDAQQDLQHLVRWTGAMPANVFDTRLAAGFCGLPSIVSLGKLVSETLGIELPKSETLTDWLRRPLTSRQLLYAAQDVAYCERIVQELFRRADAFGTTAWMLEEMRSLDDPARYAEAPVEAAVRRVKVPPRDFRGQPRRHARLAALAVWRERMARERDLPRKWVAADEVLIAAAIDPETDLSKFPKKALSPSFRTSFLAALREADEAPLPPPEPRERPAMDPGLLKSRATALLAEIARRAETLHVDPALFGSRADVSAFILNPDDPTHPLNRGWRRETMGEAIRPLV